MPDSSPNPRTALLADHVAKLVNDWPPPTEEQIDKVATILRASGEA